MTSTFMRVRGWVAILAFVGTFGPGWAAIGHVDQADDAACGRFASAGGHPTSQVEVIHDSAAGHCPFCHWQRSISGAAVSAAASFRSHFEPAESLRIPDVTAPRQARVGRQPSRAPPLNVL